MAEKVICLWYNDTAEQTASFYAQTFPDRENTTQGCSSLAPLANG